MSRFASLDIPSLGKPCLEKLTEPDYSHSLHTLLGVLNTHADLAHFRQLVRNPSDRQLALFAALERATLRGAPLPFPPQPDDHADALLCDILDALDSDPTTSHYGAAYGNDRHLANLQALGLWTNDQPNERPTALELFTTRFTDLTTNPHHDLASQNQINSPLLQDSLPDGELIAPFAAINSPVPAPPSSSQTLDNVLVVEIDASEQGVAVSTSTPGIFHQNASDPGENLNGDDLDLSPSPSPPLSPSDIPTRPVRRGRPLLLDERAKGRILGLMAYGLSLRQAASQLGLHHTTLVAAMKRDEEFADQVSESRLDAMSQPLITVVQASRRSWRAAAWLAKFLEERSNKPTTPAPQP